MLIGARTGSWSDEINRSAIWIGDLSVFDTGIFPKQGNVYDISVRFYRKDIPTTGGYILGRFGESGNQSTRSDVAVYAGSFWYRSVTRSTANVSYSEYPFVKNKVQEIRSRDDFSSIPCVASTFYNNKRYADINSSTSPTGEKTWYIGARNYYTSPYYSEPVRNTGIVSVKISVNGTPVLDAVPYTGQGRVGLRNKVDGSVLLPIYGSDPTYIGDYRDEGIVDFE